MPVSVGLFGTFWAKMPKPINVFCISQTSDEHPTCSRLTLLRCDGFIGKRFCLDDAGNLYKEASGLLISTES